tara:strand:- start:176 stop:352 length:177 start_codon:yes stop_codon:yes gene_type:complete
MKNKNWQDEMDARHSWAVANWEKTGKRSCPAGVTGSLNLGRFPRDSAEEKNSSKKLDS